MQNPKLTKAGDSTVTEQHIRWQTAANQTPMLTSVDSAEVDTIGLLEALDEELNIADATTAGAAAQARLDLLSKTPRVVTTALTGDAPTTVNQLVPGRRVEFRVTTLPYRALGTTRLQKVAVSVGQTGETVTVDTTPLGVVA